MLALKLALVAASILLSTAVARRFGHALGGVIAGMPMIAGPICAILLIDQGAQVVRAIALATMTCIPGAIVHSVTVARSSRRLPWQLCIGLALSLFMLVGPETAAGPHIKALSRISRLVRRDQVREQLFAARSAEAFYHTLQEAERAG